MDSQIKISIIIPENDKIHVQINDIKLTGQDAVKLGELIKRSGEHAALLDRMLNIMQSANVENARELCLKCLT